jgi:hypothetical protein
MPHLLFTLDFHELVHGKIQPGASCEVDYDPQRLFPSDAGYRQGDPAYPVTAHIRYLPSGQQQEIDLSSPSGVVDQPITDLNGEGSMLRGAIQVPPDADEIVTWFSGKAPGGKLYYDSEFEANYHFRFSQIDLHVKESKVINQPGTPWAHLLIVVEAKPAIERILIRYRNLNSEKPNNEIECWLTKSGLNTWTSDNSNLPYNPVVVFDILYFVEGRRFKDDNNGEYYLCQNVDHL